MEEKTTIIVRLQQERPGDWHGLKRWLKNMLRAYGLRCVGLTTDTNETTTVKEENE